LLIIIALFSIKDKKSSLMLIFMSRTCTKCKNSIPDNEQLGIVAEKYPTCNKCWAEWKEYQIMVMNEMKLDMSMPDHRKLLKKHEKIFVGVLSAEGEIIDYSNEENRNPEEPPK
jgi:Fe-S cluster biosynthesis and repair protein YggX